MVPRDLPYRQGRDSSSRLEPCRKPLGMI